MEITKQKKISLAVVFIGLSFGIILAETLSLSFLFIVFLVSLLLGVFLVVFVLRAEKRSAGLLIMSTVLCVSLAFGFVRSETKVKDFVLHEFTGKKVVILGEVVAEPEDREAYLSLVVQAWSVVTETECIKIDEKVLVRADRFSDIYYKDQVRVSGRLDRPEPFGTEVGRVFRYDKFLEKDGIGSIVSFAKIESIERSRGFSLSGLLYNAKDGFLYNINRFIPSPEVSLLGGITVGAKRSLGKELERDFRKTGIIHIVVLSGFHVVVVAEAIMFSLRYFSTRLRTLLGVIAIGLFVILVGAGATVIRAAIMATVALTARAFGRESLALQALFLAGSLMIVFNPMTLLHDPSFQLSFMATLGLILYSGTIARFFIWIKNKMIQKITVATVTAQIVVLPLLLYMMGELSLVALPVNLLVLPTVPTAMLFGFLVGVVGSIPVVSMFLGPLFGAITFFILRFELLVVKVFASLSFATVTLLPFSLALLVVIYAVLGFVLWKIKNLTLKEGEVFLE